MLLFSIALFFGDPLKDRFAAVDLAALELFGLIGIEVFRVGDDWLLCHGGKDPALVMVNRHGTPTATYRDAGDGPRQLHQPYVIGVRGDEIFVRTSHYATAVFDHLLRIRKQGPSFSRELAQASGPGTWVRDNLFLRSPRFSQKGLIQSFHLEERGWALGATFLPEYPADMRGGYTHQMHGNLHAVSRVPIHQDPGTYRVHLFSLIAGGQGLAFRKFAVLEGELGELPPVFPKQRPVPNFKVPRALLGPTCRTPTGYLVQIWSRDPEDEETLLFWGDSFNADFSFQGREAMGSKRLIPAVNDSAVFVLDTEKETLGRLY